MPQVILDKSPERSSFELTLHNPILRTIDRHQYEAGTRFTNPDPWSTLALIFHDGTIIRMFLTEEEEGRFARVMGRYIDEYRARKAQDEGEFGADVHPAVLGEVVSL